MIGKYSISANFSDEKTMNRPAKLVHSRGDGLSSPIGVKLRKGKEGLKAGGKRGDKETLVVRR
jgi:hypothetical protein